MTFSIGLLLVLVLVSLILFAVEWVSADVVAAGLLIALVLTGLLPADSAFDAFGSDTTIAIFSLLVMTAALTHTGMVDLVGRAFLRRAGDSPRRMLLIVILAAVVLSSMISNTAATALLMPVVLGTATKLRVPASRLLLPLAFGSILASSLTLVSTSTNLVVSGVMASYGQPRMGMFELTPVGLVTAAAGVVYLYFLGHRLIPRRDESKGALEEFNARSYLSELVILPDSPLAGKTLEESKLGRELDLHVVRVLPSAEPGRNDPAHQHTTLGVGDVLVVEGPREEVLKIKDTVGVQIRPEVTMPESGTDDDETLVVEGLITPGSPLAGRTLRGLSFRERFGVQVLGLHRHGRNFFSKLGQAMLRTGDILLVQGRRSRISALSDDHVFHAIGAVENRRVDRPRAWRAVAIFAGVLGAAAAGLVPLAVATFLGVFLVFATRCVSPADAYREVDWRPVILIASMLSVGQAMQSTGAAAYLADLIVRSVAGHDPRWLLAGFFVLTVLLTQPMSNQAAAVVIVPIALAAAHQLEVNPRTFAMMIAVAASCSFLTPLEPACLLVYGPGRYRFSDFVRVGAPLTVLIFLIAFWLVPYLWPLTPAAAP